MPAAIFRGLRRRFLRQRAPCLCFRCVGCCWGRRRRRMARHVGDRGSRACHVRVARRICRRGRDCSRRRRRRIPRGGDGRRAGRVRWRSGRHGRVGSAGGSRRGRRIFRGRCGRRSQRSPSFHKSPEQPTIIVSPGRVVRRRRRQRHHASPVFRTRGGRRCWESGREIRRKRKGSITVILVFALANIIEAQFSFDRASPSPSNCASTFVRFSSFSEGEQEEKSSDRIRRKNENQKYQ